MAIIKVINSKSGLKNIIDYITKENKTNKNIMSVKDCNINTALDEMIVTKKMCGKEKGRQYKHYIQSFSKDENITETEAHKIALKLATRHFKGFGWVILSYTDLSRTWYNKK